jgi:enoyl-CoA hydratase
VSDLLHVTRDGRIATVELDRPKFNTFNQMLLDDFSAVIRELGADPEVSCIVIYGAGGNFSAGYDVNPKSEGTLAFSAYATPYDDWWALRDSQKRWLEVWETPKPVISAVEGYCMGGATSLAVCTDITIVAEDAVIGWPSVPLGGGLLSPVSAWLIGPKKAKELSFIAASQFSGAEAAAMGWANEAVGTGAALDRAMELARRIVMMPLDLLRLKKLAVNRIMDIQGFREAVLFGAEWDAIAHTSPGTTTITDHIAEHGLKKTITWFGEGGAGV